MGESVTEGSFSRKEEIRSLYLRLFSFFPRANELFVFPYRKKNEEKNALYGSWNFLRDFPCTRRLTTAP